MGDVREGGRGREGEGGRRREGEGERVRGREGEAWRGEQKGGGGVTSTGSPDSLTARQSPRECAGSVEMISVFSPASGIGLEVLFFAFCFGQHLGWVQGLRSQVKGLRFSARHLVFSVFSARQWVQPGIWEGKSLKTLSQMPS